MKVILDIEDRNVRQTCIAISGFSILFGLSKFRLKEKLLRAAIK